MTRVDALYQGYCEVVPFTKKPVKVEIEDGKDELGLYVRITYQGLTSSKYRYEK